MTKEQIIDKHAQNLKSWVGTSLAKEECIGLIKNVVDEALILSGVAGQSEQLKRDTFIKSREETARAREASAIKQTLEIYCAHDELPTVNEVLERIGRKH